MMMIAVQSINKSFSPATVRYHVKKKTMSYVFKKTPEKNAADERKNDSCCVKTKTVAAEIQHINYYRGVYAPNH